MIGVEAQPLGQVPELLALDLGEFAQAARPDVERGEAEREGAEDGGFDRAPGAVAVADQGTAETREDRFGEGIGAVGRVDDLSGGGELGHGSCLYALRDLPQRRQ